MSEKKERQYAVLFFDSYDKVVRVKWWDARKDARTAATAHNGRNTGNKTYARVMPMTRGDGA